MILKSTSTKIAGAHKSVQVLIGLEEFYHLMHAMAVIKCSTVSFENVVKQKLHNKVKPYAFEKMATMSRKTLKSQERQSSAQISFSPINFHV